MRLHKCIRAFFLCCAPYASKVPFYLVSTDYCNIPMQKYFWGLLAMDWRIEEKIKKIQIEC